MSYFEYLPKVEFRFPDGVLRTINDLSTRAKIRDSILNNSASFQKHFVRDGETPESLANLYYGSADLHWIIMMTNNITSVYNDWPRDQRSFNEYLFQKYKNQTDSDGTAVTLTRTEVVEFTEFVGSASNDYKGSVAGLVIKPDHFVDSKKNKYSYDFIVNANAKDAFGRTLVKPTVTPVSIRNVEETANEAKRDILILEPSLALRTVTELKSLF